MQNPPDTNALQNEDGDEVFLFSPYNANNKEITRGEVQSILTKYGVASNLFNLELYKRAFVHRSYTKRPEQENKDNNIILADRPVDCIPLKTKSNERLEFIGDGVLELITKYYLYRRFPKADEGFMTEKKIALVKNEHIGSLAYEMRLHNWLLLSNHAEEKKTRTNLKKLGCLFEAFLGALFLDFNKIDVKDENNWFQDVFVCGPGFQMCQIFVENIFENHVDWMKLIETDDNYKNILQVKIQKEFKVTPDYLEMDNDPEIGYKMGVYLCIGTSIHNQQHQNARNFSEFGSFAKIQEYLEQENSTFVLLGEGTHKIKKKAEQLACEKAIQAVG